MLYVVRQRFLIQHLLGLPGCKFIQYGDIKDEFFFLIGKSVPECCFHQLVQSLSARKGPGFLILLQLQTDRRYPAFRTVVQAVQLSVRECCTCHTGVSACAFPGEQEVSAVNGVDIGMINGGFRTVPERLEDADNVQIGIAMNRKGMKDLLWNPAFHKLKAVNYQKSFRRAANFPYH